jgi:Ca-activated chloride channel family protein
MSSTKNASCACVTAALLALIVPLPRSTAQAEPRPDNTYRLTLPVDEVSLTFHAADADGLPVNDLKAGEITLLDNGRAPRRIVAFQRMQAFPIHAGILIDTSESMTPHQPHARAIAMKYADHLLRAQTDQAFVMDFGLISAIRQPWTGIPATLSAAIRRIEPGKQNPLGGTRLFDTIFRACFNLFGKTDNAASGNFVLLFTDGQDNASYVSLAEAVDQCQHSNTAIYAFRAETDRGAPSTGPKKLAELATQTGGRVFSDEDSDAAIDEDLRTIEADLRNQYRLIYNPAQLRHDGAFHRVVLLGPDRVATINVRSGYYAPSP